MFNDIDEIEDNLYLGNFQASENIQQLKDLGIKKVLSVIDNDDFPNYKSEGIIHKKVDVSDFEHQNIIQYFGECLNFIKGEEKVLVHCMAGASRSATIVIAYVMWINKMKYEDVLNFVMLKRPIVYPNNGFREQLKIFEKLLVDNNYDIDKINFSEIKWDLPQYFEDEFINKEVENYKKYFESD